MVRGFGMSGGKLARVADGWAPPYLTEVANRSDGSVILANKTEVVDI